MSEAVLDTSALLALFRNEPGADRVWHFMGSAAISAVNLTETVTKLIQRGVPPSDAWDRVSRLDLMICSFDEALARSAIDLAPLAYTEGLSFADRACLATARSLNVPAVTADRKWASLPLPCHVICIR